MDSISKYRLAAVGTEKTACTAVFVDNVADRFDSYAVSGVFGGLENIVFLLYFAIEGILRMDQKEMIMVGINFHINLSAGGYCFHACLDGIFQQIGEHKAQIDLIYGKISRQGNHCMKRNVFSLGKGGIIYENTVNSLIFTEMQIIVRDFAGCSREIFFNFFYVTLFCQSGQTDKMMADIVTCLPCFFNGHAEILVSFLLKGKKMVLLLKSGISVQADCHYKKHGIKHEQDYEQYKTENNIALQDPFGI